MRAFWRWTLGVAAVAVAALILLVVFFDWNWLKAPLESRLAALTGKTVKIEGNMSGSWSWIPHLTFDKVHIDEPAFKTAPHVVDIDRVVVELDLKKLLHGKLDFPMIEIARPRIDLARDANGTPNWKISGPTAAPQDRTEMPLIESLKIDDGHLTYRDPHKHLAIDAAITSVTGRGNGGHTTIEGHGTYKNAPFALQLEGGPLEALRSTKDPYDLDLAVAVGDTKVTAIGTVGDPLKMTDINVKLTAQGDTAEELYPLFGIPAPSTPPYKLAGTFDRDGAIWLFKNFSGTVGKSDLSGTLRFEPDRPRLRVSGNLASKTLDFADLGLLVGTPGNTSGDRPTSSEQKRLAAKYEQSDRVLPDAPLNVEEVRNVDVDLTFKGEHIQAQTLPLENADLALTIDNGMLSMHPLRAGVAGGKINANIVIDARQQPVMTDYDVRFRRFALAPFFERAGFPQGGTGFLDGRVKLHGIGDSVRKSLATANGQAGLIVDDGTISNLAANILGLDVARALGLYISGNDKQIALRCFVADFQVDEGLMRPRMLLLDTAATQITGEGTVSLADEALDLKIHGAPKSPTPLHLGGPIEIGGTFKHPDAGLGAGTIARGGAALALGVLLTPLASILGFVDPGNGHDADCAKLESDARASTNTAPAKAPVPPVRTTKRNSSGG